MRLKIVLKCENLRLPLNHKNVLQGMIYNIFEREEYGRFLHEEGYKYGKKTFKMFVFSDIFGKYIIEERNIVFSDKICFYIGSQSEDFLKIIYETLLKNEYLSLYFQKVEVESISFMDIPYFKGLQKKKIRTISPIVAYKTVDKYVHYFKPSDEEFLELCLTNLIEKNEALDTPLNGINFLITDVVNQKKRMIKFKNTFYESHFCELDIVADYDTLLLIYNTGLSAKGSSGFGMIEIV